MGEGGIAGFCEYFDIFPRQLSFTMKGKDSYRTACGGLTSLIIFALMAFYMFILLTQPLEAEKSISAVVTQVTSGDTDTNDTDTNDTNTGDSGDSYTFDAIPTYKKTTKYLDSYYSYGVYWPGQNNFQFGASMINGFDVNGLYIEFWGLTYTDNDGFYYSYLESMACTLDMFPDDVYDEGYAIGLDYYYVCPNLTDWAMVGNNRSPEYQYIEIDTVKCFNGDCYDDVTMESMYTYELLQVVFTEPYFDDSDPDDPIKYRLNTNNNMAVNINGYVERYNLLSPNKLIDFDGNTEEFYTLQPGYVNNFFYDETYIVIDYYMIGNSYDLYEQYYSYKPVTTLRNLDSKHTQAVIEPEDSHRHLESSETEELLSSEYSILYILSQLGGLYSILVLIFGIFVGHVTSKSFEHDIINSVYKYNATNQMAMGQGGARNNQFKGPGNAYNVNDPNGSVVQENDPLVNGVPSASNVHATHSMARQKSSKNSARNHMYDGGEDMAEIERTRNAEMGGQDVYSNSDLMYSIFCCRSAGGGRRTKAGRNEQLQKEVRALNQERDLVHVVTNMSMIQARMENVEQKLEEQSLSQNVSDPIWRKNQVKQAPAQIVNQNEVAAHAKSQVKKQSTVVKKAVQKAKNPNSSLSQILDDIDNRGKIKEEVKSINDIMANEMNAIKNDSNYNKSVTQKSGKSKNKSNVVFG